MSVRVSTRFGDRVFSFAAHAAGVLVLLLLGSIIVLLFIGGLPAFRAFGFGFLTSTAWNPVTARFGALISVYGTVVSSLLALIMAVPLAFGVAFFLTELAPSWLRRPVGTAIELLAAVPSIIYGMWGFFVLAPLVSQTIKPALANSLGHVPGLGPLFRTAPGDSSIFTAALVLAIMIIPFIAATMRDVFLTVPVIFKESAFGLGCTPWEVMRSIVLPYTRASVVGGIMLGLGRALGETMAVTFVIGNTNRITPSIFAPGNTIASLVALEFPESDNGSLQLSSLLALGFILFVISFGVLALSRALLGPAGGGMSATLADRRVREVAAVSLGRRRRATDRIARLLAGLATLVALGFLASILITLLYLGLPGLSLHMFGTVTKAPGAGGGLANAIVGSVAQAGLGTLIGTPIGLMVGTYLAEYAGRSVLGNAVRFVSDILLSAPSILIGLFIYQILVAPLGGFSGFAGAVALAILVIPIVVRTTEDMLRLIPISLREASIALGAPRWKTTVFICYRAVLDGLLTGVLLAVARVAGETAPLLFTSLGNSDFSGLGSAMSSLPVSIYQYAASAFDDWVQLAWTGALLITLGVLAINVVARFAIRRR